MFSDTFFKGANVPTSSIDQAAVQALIDSKLADLGSTLANTQVIGDLSTDVAALIDSVNNKADSQSLTTLQSTLDALTTTVNTKGDKFAAYTIKQCDTAGDIYHIIGVVDDFGKLILIQDGSDPVIAPSIKYTYSVNVRHLVENPDLPYSMTFYNHSDAPVEFIYNNENDSVLVDGVNHAIRIISRYNYVILSPRGSCTIKVLHQSIYSKTVGADTTVYIHPILLIGNLQATV